jgi:hypothetical protein
MEVWKWLEQELKVPRQGMNDGTLFIEINQNLLDSDKTKLKIEVYNGNKKLKQRLLIFKSAKFWLNSMKFKVQNL